MATHPIDSLATFMRIFRDDSRLQGVRLVQLRTLCAEHQIGRWKVSPEGTSDRPRMLRALLDPHLHIFGTTANRSIGATAHDMVPGVLCRLLASDYVAVLDDRHGTWQAIMNGTLVPSTPSVPAELRLPHDVVRRENILDLMWLKDNVILPSLVPQKFGRPA
jgi:hypothetical protein